MNFKTLTLLALVVLVSSTFAVREMSQHETRQAGEEETKGNVKPASIQVDYKNVKGGWFGGGGGAWSSGGGGWSGWYNHGGEYGSGQKCHFGCCGESFGWSLGGGAYYTCKCCLNAAEAKAYKLTQPKELIND